MYRFLRKLGLFMMLLVLTASGLYLTSESVAPVYSAIKERASQLEEKRRQIEAITIYNSHNAGVDFGVMGVDGFHLSRGGADIFEAAYVLRNVYPRLDSLKYVLMPVPIYAIDNSTFPDRVEKRKEMYAGYYFGMEYVEGDATLFFKAELSPIIRTDNWREVLWPEFAESEASRRKEDSLASNGLIVARVQGLSTPVDMAASGVGRARRHMSLQEQSLDDHPDLCNDALAEVESIAKTLREGSVFVLYEPPYTDAYKQEIEKQSGCASLRKRVQEVAARYPNTVLFDLSSVLPKKDPHRYFRDGDHLNARGAQIMSRALRDSLRSL